MKTHKRLLIYLIGFVFPVLANAQSSTYIDGKGVMRWSENKKEVCSDSGAKW